MVYKKYIKKGGKLYGPYIYHSKRVDGKVVSEYHGVKKTLNYKNFILISLGVLVLLILIYFLIFADKGITGRVAFSIDAKYQEGQNLEGKLNLVLKEGELIPNSSKIIFENAGQIYEVVLNEVVSDNLVEGDFYVTGETFSGTGSGYGIQGTKTDYPDVYFVLDVYSEQTSEEESSSGESETESEEPEETTEVVNESVEEEIIEETEEPIEETTENPEEVIEEPIEPEQEEIIEESGEEIVEEVVEETETEVLEEVEELEEEPESESVEEEVEEEPETQEPATTPITGGVISRIFKLTGKVTMELENEIQGKVSVGEEFVYELEPGQTIELRPKSVRTDSKELNDNDVSVKIQDNKVIVTTDYSEKQKGFGEDYLGNNEKTLSIDLDKLNLVLEKGELITKLVYENEEIISLRTVLEEGETISNETVIEEGENETIIEKPELNETIEEMNQTINETKQEILIEDIGDFLTEEEKEILVNEFGNASIKTAKAESFKDRIVMGYEIGNYNVEYSYDSSLSDEVLESQMEQDRIKWLKDIVNALSNEKSPSQELEKFKKDYGVFD